METWITYISAAIVFIGVTLTVWSKIREYRENHRGWRLGHDVYGIRYEEKIKEGTWASLLVRVTYRGHYIDEILIPSEAAWDLRFPLWAHGRREEIVSRIRSERSRLKFAGEPIQIIADQRASRAAD